MTGYIKFYMISFERQEILSEEQQFLGVVVVFGGRNQTTRTGLEPQHRKEHRILLPLSRESNSTKN